MKLIASRSLLEILCQFFDFVIKNEAICLHSKLLLIYLDVFDFIVGFDENIFDHDTNELVYHLFSLLLAIIQQNTLNCYNFVAEQNPKNLVQSNQNGYHQHMNGHSHNHNQNQNRNGYSHFMNGGGSRADENDNKQANTNEKVLQISKIIETKLIEIVFNLSKINSGVRSEVTKLCISHMLFPLTTPQLNHILHFIKNPKQQQNNESTFVLLNKQHLNDNNEKMYIITTHAHQFEQQFLRSKEVRGSANSQRLIRSRNNKLKLLSNSNKGNVLTFRHRQIFDDLRDNLHEIKLISLQQGRIVIPNPQYSFLLQNMEYKDNGMNQNGGDIDIDIDIRTHSSNNSNSQPKRNTNENDEPVLKLRPKARVNPYAKALLKQLKIDETKFLKEREKRKSSHGHSGGRNYGHGYNLANDNKLDITCEMLEECLNIRREHYNGSNGKNLNKGKNNKRGTEEKIDHVHGLLYGDDKQGKMVRDCLRRLYNTIENCMLALWMRLVWIDDKDKNEIESKDNCENKGLTVVAVDAGIESMNYLCELLPSIDLSPSNSKYKSVINLGNTLMFDNDISIIFESFPILFNIFIVLTKRYQCHFNPLIAYVRSLMAKCHKISNVLLKKENILSLNENIEKKDANESSSNIEIERDGLVCLVSPLFDCCYNIGIISLNFYKIKVLLYDLTLKNLNTIIHVLCQNPVLLHRTMDVFNNPKKYLIDGSKHGHSRWLKYDFDINYEKEYGLKYGNLFTIKITDKMINDQTYAIKQVLIPTKQLIKFGTRYDKLIASIFANL